MAAKKKRKIHAKDLRGLKYFKLLNPLLERLHDVGTQRDTAGNRQLFFDQYASRPLFLSLPTLASLQSAALTPKPHALRRSSRRPRTSAG